MIPDKKSIKLIRESKKYISEAHFSPLYGIVIKSGNKNKIKDINGKEYIDLLSGACVASLGYNNKKIIRSINKQYLLSQHDVLCYSASINSLNFSKKIIKTFSKKDDVKLLFGLSGGDANETAIKCAFNYTKKTKVISFKNSWHGVFGLSEYASGFKNKNNSNFFKITFPKDKESYDTCLKELNNLLKNKDISCMIMECILGDGGNFIPYKNSLKEIEFILKKNNVLLIIDEVQSGNGRSGKYWEFENFNLKPDIITTGKGLTGGYYPLSICLARKDIVDTIKQKQLIFTYAGNPIGCAAAITVVKEINNPFFLNRIKEMGNIYIKEFKEAKKKYKIIKEIRGLGLHLGLEIECEYANAGILGLMCAERGVYPGYFGANNEVLRIHPPLTITEKEVKKSIKIILECIEIIENKKIPTYIYKNYEKYCIGLGENKELEIL